MARFRYFGSIDTLLRPLSSRINNRVDIRHPVPLRQTPCKFTKPRESEFKNNLKPVILTKPTINHTNSKYSIIDSIFYFMSFSLLVYTFITD